MPKGQEFAVLLRIYPDKADIDPRNVERVLELTKPSPLISGTAFNKDTEMLTVSIGGAPSLDGAEVERWQTTEFKNISEWLTSKSPSQFEEIADLGLTADAYVSRYWGRIPDELLREIVRLGIGLWVSG